MSSIPPTSSSSSTSIGDRPHHARRIPQRLQQRLPNNENDRRFRVVFNYNRNLINHNSRTQNNNNTTTTSIPNSPPIHNNNNNTTTTTAAPPVSSNNNTTTSAAPPLFPASPHHPDGDIDGDTPTNTRQRRISLQVPQPVPLARIHVTFPPRQPVPWIEPKQTNSTITCTFPQAFECNICFETIVLPAVSCGKCDARFCHGCLKQAIEIIDIDDTQQQTKKCPCCRIEIKNVEAMVIDQKLEYQMRSYTEVQDCMNKPYGCDARLRPIHITSHENQCLFRQMKCKFAPFGCTYIGPLKNIDAHDIECAYKPMEFLIDQVEKLRIEAMQMTSMLSSRFAQERFILASVTNQLASLHQKHLNNIFHMLQCIYGCTCHPIMFIREGIMWKSFWNCIGSRAVVNNFLTVMPLMLWVVKTGIFGFKQLWKWMDKFDQGTLQYDDDDDYLLIPNFILGLCTILLGITFILCFYIDGRSSMRWQNLPLKLGRFKTPDFQVISHLQIVQSILLHFLCIELENSNGMSIYNLKGIFKTLLIMLSSYFPSIVECVLLVAAKKPLPKERSEISKGRAFHMNREGLKYGFILYYCGFTSTILGTSIYLVFIEIASKKWKWWKEESNNLLFNICGSHLPHVLCTLITLRSTWLAIVFPSWDEFSIAIIQDVIPGFTSYIMILFFVTLQEGIDWIGSMLGLHIAKKVIDLQISLYTTSFAFGVWSVLLSLVFILP